MNLVLGTALRLSIPQLRVFTESLRRHFSGDIILLIASSNADSVIPYLHAHKVTPIFFDCANWMRMNLSIARFVRYGELLRHSSTIYDKILLTDVSDVLFQSDPFANLPSGDLLCFLEHRSRLIGDCLNNSMWVEQHLGAEALAKVRHQVIACSGTTFGTHAAILAYIDRLLSLGNPVLLNRYHGMRGVDQGFHNFLLHTGALPHANLLPNGTHVYTVGCAPDNECLPGPNGTILTPAGTLCPIVHQYTYKPKLLDHVNAAWPAITPPTPPTFFIRGTPFSPAK